MKRSIVPAQITTVEDKIAANLTLRQMILLAVPFFLGFLIFVGLPPILQATPYKLAIFLLLLLIFGVLSIRIKERLVLEWAGTISTYNLRPKYYVYDKKDYYLRDGLNNTPQEEPVAEKAPEPVSAQAKTQISTADRVKIEDIMSNPKAKLHFRANRKGALRAFFTEIE